DGGNPAATPVLTGTVSDGGGVAGLVVRLVGPDGVVSWITPTVTAGAWEFVPLVDAMGNYVIDVETWDLAGNLRSAGSFYLAIVDAPITNLALLTTGPAGQGQVVTFTATISSGSSVSYTWNFGDGTPPQSTGPANVTGHVYWLPGEYLATVMAENSLGVVTATAGVTINNVPPTVAAGPDQTVTAGAPVFFNGSFSDPGILDTHTIVWDFGDTIITTGTLTPSHIYNSPGVYTVTLTVTDDHGGVGQDTLVVTVEANGYLIYLPAIIRPDTATVNVLPAAERLMNPIMALLQKGVKGGGISRNPGRAP
ncbi:MAG: PKD domain-containing protein, partial [Chloroflexi bacterium]|nr:PKD domain-containing protein [Chloroflexota bacterium]